jgi:hypothetical protein
MSNDPDHKPVFLIDLDGTLAHYTGWQGVSHIGEPVAPMLSRVKKMLEDGKDVRIFTARVWPLTSFEDVNSFMLAKRVPETEEENAAVAGLCIREWCTAHLGRIIPITCRKDRHAVELWDDRAIGVVLNRGISHESMVAFHLLRVLESAGIKVADGTPYAPAADRAVSTIRTMMKCADDAIAHLDATNDALSYVKGEKVEDDARNIRHARTALTKALAAIRQLVTR